MKKVLTIFGTRPEAIKMAPIILELKKDKTITNEVCITAQHREMLDQVLNLFEIEVDYDLNVMTKNQDLYDVTSKILLGVRDVLHKSKPDMILVHGDTTTCFAAGLAAFYEKIPVAHVEAGLRSGDNLAPFPEEMNRKLIGRIAQIHFAPTNLAKNNLLAENVDNKNIYVTGNSVIDALHLVVNKVNQYEDSHWKKTFGEILFKKISNNRNKTILITGHRRENFGKGFIDLCMAIKEIANKNKNLNLIYPVHLNPNVQKPVKDILSDLNNVYLLEPLEYEPFVWLMDKCNIILTDSGGIQEEGPSLGKPVLVMRNATERLEALDAGTIKLVGTKRSTIINSVNQLMNDQCEYFRMSNAKNPYGNGNASAEILRHIKNFLN